MKSTDSFIALMNARYSFGFSDLIVQHLLDRLLAVRHAFINLRRLVLVRLDEVNRLLHRIDERTIQLWILRSDRSASSRSTACCASCFHKSSPPRSCSP